MDIKTILYFITAGIGVATLMIYYNKRFLGGFVRKLLEIDATAPESAVTPAELNMKLTPALKHALRPNTSFSDTVLVTEDGRYFVPAHRVKLASYKYRDDGVTALYILLLLLMLFAAAIVCSYIFPEAVGYVEDILSTTFGRGE